MQNQTPIKEVLKPWGKEIWFSDQPAFVGKILFINKGHRYSLQYHEKKVETQYLIKGICKFLIGPDEDNLEEVILKPGDKLDVYPGMIHRAEAIEDVEIVEVSSNDLDDVVKLADDYGRSGKGNDHGLDAELATKEA
jgi:mannose-6-phosphate isomerase